MPPKKNFFSVPHFKSRCYITSIRDDTVGGDTNGDGASSTPQLGDWTQIAFQDSSNDSTSLIDHAIIRYGGGNYSNAVTLTSASPTIRHTTFSSNWRAIVADLASFPSLSNITFTNNGLNGFGIRGGTLGNNATWNQIETPYYLLDNVAVGVNATLTINPGVVVKFEGSKSLIIQGSLRVLGTAEQPIYFTSRYDDAVGGDTNGDGASSTPQPGDWTQIAFQDSSNDSTSLIDHAIIRYGGGNYSNAVTLTSASPTIRHTTFSSNWRAIVADLASFPSLSNITFTNNGLNGFGIRGGTLGNNATWNQIEIPYYLLDNVAVGVNATLTINPGVVVKFEGSKSLIIQGSLRVLGTAEQPIYFTSRYDDAVGGDTNGDGASSTPQLGDWTQIAFQDSSNDSTSLIDHAIIRYAGGNYSNAVTLTSASPTIRHTTFSSNWRAIVADLASFPSLSNITFTNNGLNGLGIWGGTLGQNATWNQTETPYYLLDEVAVGVNVTLTINPGVVVKFERSKSLIIQGSLRVLGTAEQPIYLTSRYDDAVGGDTNGDGASSTPQPGDWTQIAFQDSSNDSTSLIDHAVIRYGGSNYSGAVALASASPTIRHTVITYSDYYGLYTNNAAPILTCNDFTNNRVYGLYNATTSVLVSAKNQWWGSASGPQHATNPTGAGDKITDGVDFAPWRSSSCFSAPAKATDLSVSISVTPDTATWGYELNYRIKVTNNGPLDATKVTIVNTLPDMVEFTSAIAGQWACNTLDDSKPGGTMTCVRELLPSGASDTILITVSPHNGSGTLVNKATVSAKESDPNMTNNTATSQTPLIPYVAKPPTVEPSNGARGAPGSYFLFTVMNFAPNTQVSIAIDGRTIFTLTSTTNGTMAFILFFAENARPGSYTIAVTGDTPSSNSVFSGTATAQTSITLDPAATKLTKSGNAPVIQALPTIYLPFAIR